MYRIEPPRGALFSYIDKAIMKKKIRCEVQTKAVYILYTVVEMLVA